MQIMDAKGNSKSGTAQTVDPLKRRALGKGLESLLSGRAYTGIARTSITDSGTDRAATAPDEGGKPREIPVDQIDPNPYQTRMSFDGAKLDELARSIEANGVVQPIIVRPLPNGRFQLIAGERRWRASEKINRPTVPAILRQVSDEQAMEMTIVENLQRADLNPIEQARAYERLSKDFKVTQEQMALRTGKDRTTVANFLRLLKLPPEVQGLIEKGDLSFGHAKILGALDSPEMILKVATKITAQAMSVRQSELYVQGIVNPTRREKPQAEPHAYDANVRAVQESLQRHLGLKVRVEDKNGRGKVIIEYSRLEDFDSIMTVLGGVKN